MALLSESCDHIQDGRPFGVFCLPHSIAETTHSDTLPDSSSNYTRSSPPQMSLSPVASKGATTANLPVATPPPQIPFAANPAGSMAQTVPMYGASSSMLPPVHPKRVRRTPSSKYEEDDHLLPPPRVSHGHVVLATFLARF